MNRHFDSSKRMKARTESSVLQHRVLHAELLLVRLVGRSVDNGIHLPVGSDSVVCTIVEVGDIDIVVACICHHPTASCEIVAFALWAISRNSLQCRA